MKFSRKFFCSWVLYLTEAVNLVFAQLVSEDQADEPAGGRPASRVLVLVLVLVRVAWWQAG